MQTEFETLCQLLREENFQELDQYNEQVFKKKYGSTAIIEILAYENNKVAVEYILSKCDMISLAAHLELNCRETAVSLLCMSHLLLLLLPVDVTQ